MASSASSKEICAASRAARFRRPHRGHPDDRLREHVLRVGAVDELLGDVFARDAEVDLDVRVQHVVELARPELQREPLQVGRVHLEDDGAGLARNPRSGKSMPESLSPPTGWYTVPPSAIRVASVLSGFLDAADRVPLERDEHAVGLDRLVVVVPESLEDRLGELHPGARSRVESPVLERLADRAVHDLQVLFRRTPAPAWPAGSGRRAGRTGRRRARWPDDRASLVLLRDVDDRGLQLDDGVRPSRCASTGPRSRRAGRCRTRSARPGRRSRPGRAVKSAGTSNLV